MKTILSGLALLAVVGAAPVLAKRLAPNLVEPVVFEGVEYSAPPEAMGFVIASDARTHAELWRRRIYEVTIKPDLERDVQDVFITALAIKRNFLMVTNERGEMYALDLSTRTVAPVAGKR